MSTKKNILFIAEDVTLAHVGRLITLATSLPENKYNIKFATGSSSKKIIDKYGIQYQPIKTLGSQIFIERLAKGNRVFTYDELKLYVEDDLVNIEQLKPDLIIGDFRISLGISAEISGVPYISILNAHWSPYSTSKIPFPEHPISKIFGLNFSAKIFNLIQPLIFKYHCLPFNKLRKHYGLKPLNSLRHIYSHCNWALYADTPELAPTSNLPDTHHYLGPVLWSPEIELPDWWPELTKNKQKPWVYLTLGSSGNIKVIDTILKILSKLPINVVLTSANRFSQQNTTTNNNIYCAQYLPGEIVANEASVVICSGGSATAYQALAHGKPVLGFPSNTDQHFTMTAIQKAGAGLSIRIELATEDNIEQALMKLIDDKKFTLNAERMQKDFKKYIDKQQLEEFLNSIYF